MPFLPGGLLRPLILCFISLKCEVVDYPTLKKVFLSRTGAFIVKVNKSG